MLASEDRGSLIAIYNSRYLSKENGLYQIMRSSLIYGWQSAYRLHLLLSRCRETVR